MTNLFNFVMFLRKFIKRDVDKINFASSQLFFRQIQALYTQTQTYTHTQTHTHSSIIIVNSYI